jgi:hypothetical protein
MGGMGGPLSEPGTSVHPVAVRKSHARHCLNAAASALDELSVPALQSAIMTYCGG